MTKTPLRTRLAVSHHISGSSGSLSAIDEANRTPGSGAMVRRDGSGIKVTLSTAQAPQKIVQTMLDTVYVVRIGERVLSFTHSTPCPLAIVESTAAPVLMDVQRRLSKLTPSSKCFKTVLRLATTDSYSALVSAEASLAADRAGKLAGGHLKCSVHKAATVHGRVFAFVEDSISSMVNLALALRTGSAMPVFRKCLQAEISSRLELRHGRPSQDAVRYKRTLLQMCVQHGAGALVRRVLLASVPNGDWRAPKVQFFVDIAPPGVSTDRSSVLEFLTAGLMAALTASQPTLYPRHRWVGADIAVSELAIMEGCHRLLSTTFARVCAAHARGSTRSAFLAEARTLAVYDSSVAGSNFGGEIQDEPVEAHILPIAIEQGDSTEDTQAGGAGDSNTTMGGNAFAEENARRRRLGLQFCRQNPLGTLLVVRILLEPLRQYMSAQFQRASRHFEFTQRAKEARAVVAGSQYQR